MKESFGCNSAQYTSNWMEGCQRMQWYSQATNWVRILSLTHMVHLKSGFSVYVQSSILTVHKVAVVLFNFAKGHST